MGAKDLDLLSLFSLLLFLVPVFYINARLKLKISSTVVTSVVRMCLQLGFVGLYLEFLFKFNSSLLNIFYLLIMVSIACHSIIKSSRLRLKVFFIPLFSALVVPFFAVLLFFNLAVAKIEMLFDAKYLIPIGGMLLGNSLRSIIICLNGFYSGIRKDEKVYLYSLSLLNSRMAALKPYFLDSFSAALAPILASMATIGLVSLPGMMTGQILGGSSPAVAIKYQIAIMMCIFYTEYFCTILAIVFSLKAGFNRFDVLNPEIFIDRE